MKQHDFKETNRKEKLLKIWRCDRCDSEVAFDEKLTYREVNTAVLIRWPKFACAPKLLN